MTVDLVTFGCRLNAYESEVIREQAAGCGDAVVINTCAVTAEAVRQAKQSIRRIARERPDARIVVTGCAAQTEAETFAAMPEIDRVIGNEEKLDRNTWATLDRAEKVSVGDIMTVRQARVHRVGGLEGRARAFVQVQNGCDHRCTFCIIPYGRGNSRFVPIDEVVSQVRSLCENGYREVVLTGVDITSWGGDLPGRPRLGGLVRAILRHVPALDRLRLSSIDSIEADADLMRALAEEERLMPHLHLSLQAGDDMILKRMKRRHVRADAVRFCEEARRLRPDIVFGADLIAGFPTETEAMFESSLALVEDCGLAFLHVFPFSPRNGTPAARMPQLDRRVVKDRARRLRERGEAARRAMLAAETGRRRSALIEKPGFGRTEHYAGVAVEGGEPGAIVPVRITGVADDRLIAVVIRDAA